jgi:hypothetical protein
MLESTNQHRVIRLCVSSEARDAISRLAKARGTTVTALIEQWIVDKLADDLAPFLVAEATEAAQRMIEAGVRAEVPKTWTPKPAPVVEVCAPEDAPASAIPRQPREKGRGSATVYAPRKVVIADA